MTVMTIKGKYGPEYQICSEEDGVIGRALKSGEPYESKFLYHVYSKGFEGAAVDIGAHIGNHTLWFALACGLRVYAYEPQKFSHLQDNIDLNKCSEWAHAFPFALGDEIGTASYVEDGVLCKEPGDITVYRLDDFNLDNIGLIKIDVEEMEPEVLRGARDTIRRCRPVIYAEERDTNCAFRNAQEMGKLGYTTTSNVFGATPLREWIPC